MNFKEITQIVFDGNVVFVRNQPIIVPLDLLGLLFEEDGVWGHYPLGSEPGGGPAVHGDEVFEFYVIGDWNGTACDMQAELSESIAEVLAVVYLGELCIHDIRVVAGVPDEFYSWPIVR